MNIDFHVADFLKLPIKVFAALSLATGMVLFLPDKFISKLYMLKFRNEFGFAIGIVFIISIAIVVISLCIAMFEYCVRIIKKIRFKLKSKTWLEELDDYQRFIVYGLYCQYNHTDELPLNDGAVRYLEQKRMIGKATNQYLVMDVNNAVFPYMLQPWVVRTINKNKLLRDEFMESFESVSSQLKKVRRTEWY